jgi:hypothetical protein
MHCLERRLVRFLRLHRATLGLFSCLIPEGCGPDPAGFSGPYSGVLCHPFEGHCCRPSAPDTSTTALAARKSTSCSLVGLSLGDRRSFGPLSCTYVISFPGPHSELPVSLFSLVHRDRHSRPARAPVHAPAHLPSLVASPITHTPGRSESTRLCAPRGECCRFVVRSAGLSSVDFRRPAGLCWHRLSRRISLVAMLVGFGSRDAECASVTCAPLRRRQMACCSRACPYAAAALLCHLGPLLHFKKSASGCCQPPPAGGPLARRPQ